MIRVGVRISGFLQLAHALAKRFAEVPQFARPKNHQHDRQDQDQMSWLQGAHG